MHVVPIRYSGYHGIKTQSSAGQERNEILNDIRRRREPPPFIAFAEVETKLHNDSEFLAILAEMDAAGQGFESELLSIEITKE